jgi:hypothetical protein
MEGMANHSMYGGSSSSRGGGRGGRGGFGGRTQTRDFRREGGKDDYGPRGGMDLNSFLSRAGQRVEFRPLDVCIMLLVATLWPVACVNPSANMWFD